MDLQQQFFKLINMEVDERITVAKLVNSGFHRDAEAGFSAIAKRGLIARLLGSQHYNDALCRYRAAKARGIFLYTSQDQEFINYLRKYWRALDKESGSIFHFFDYGLQGVVSRRKGAELDAYTYAEEHIRSLKIIPGADLEKIRSVGLPCLLVWCDFGNCIVPLADVQGDFSKTRDRFREVLYYLSKDQFWELEYRYHGAAPLADSSNPDVFLSYQHKDRDWVQSLADSLSAAGTNVWFDKHIKAGERWDLRISDMISRANTTIVVWSKSSIESSYVLAEAQFARSRRNVVPVYREIPIELPVPFNTLQTLDLSKWNPSESLPVDFIKSMLPYRG